MRLAKKQLIATVFDLAKTIDTKVLMSEGEFNDFIDAYDNNGERFNKLVEHNYLEACANKNIQLDHAPTYGGYGVERLAPTTSATSFITSCRYDAGTLSTIIRAYISGHGDGQIKGLNYAKKQLSEFRL